MDKLAEEEEEEALALQRQMAASLEEQDFDADEFEVLFTFSNKPVTFVSLYSNFKAQI